ncbi:MAG: chromosome segregation ATPase [Paracoccaceae bacterium]|jgi:chromosome segregation ATPase
MSDHADLDQISALEERITQALDRISRGMPALGAMIHSTDGADQVAALEVALEAERAHVTELSTVLANATATATVDDRVLLEEAQSALAAALAANVKLSETSANDVRPRVLRRAEAAAQTAQTLAEQLEAQVQELSQQNTALQAQLDAVDTAAEAPGVDIVAVTAEMDAMRAQEEVLRNRVGWMRAERNKARAERDLARDELEEMASGGAALAPRIEISQLRDANAALIASLESLRANDPEADQADAITAALSAELNALKAERAVDAVELRDILAEMRPLTEEETARA